MSLILLRGPAGGGKSGLAREMIGNGQAQVQGDVTALWAALTAALRDPETGRYPERLDSDPALTLALQMQLDAARAALSEGLDVVVTTSQSAPDQIEKWQEVADDAGTDLQVQTVDPGESVARARLADELTGRLSPACARALGRWYG